MIVPFRSPGASSCVSVKRGKEKVIDFNVRIGY